MQVKLVHLEKYIQSKLEERKNAKQNKDKLLDNVDQGDVNEDC